MVKHTCCFTGHRKLPAKKINTIVFKLNEAVERLIQEGVTNFLCGGALGFDQIAASLIIAKKEMGYNIRLIMALPYKGQEDLWTIKQKQLYRHLLDAADAIEYISESYTKDCLEKCNQYMIDESTYCICALIREMSKIGKTVRYAKEKNRQIINIAK